MSYRDDTAAAEARADAAEHTTRVLAAEHARLTADLAAAREWLGGSRRRWAIGTAITAAVALAAGFAIARFTTAPFDDGRRPGVQDPFTEVSGSLVVLGPDFGRGALKASVCFREAPDTARVGLLGTGNHSIVVKPGSATLILAGAPYPLDKAHCSQLVSAIAPDDQGAVAGSVDLDCAFGDNRVVGRFAFSHCR